ncbi:MAG: HEAT repeat domain-containing protein [Polyangiales bacterium]
MRSAHSLARIVSSLSLAMVLSWQSTPASARVAPAAPPSAMVHLGRPAQLVAIDVRAIEATRGEPGATVWELTANQRSLAALPFRPTTLSARELALEGGTVALVEAQAGVQRYVLLLGRRGGRALVLDEGRADLHGDPGERRAHVLRVLDGTDVAHAASAPPAASGSGAVRVLRATVTERVAVCGATETWLDVQALDPRTLAFHPTPQPAPASSPTQTQTARLAPPDFAAPRLDALHFDVASSGAGEGSYERAPRPVALTDRDASTAWVEAEPTRGSVAFVTGRFDALEWPVRVVSLVPWMTNAPPDVRPPAYVDLVTPDARVRVQVPPDVQPGARYVVTLDPPVAFRCVSVLLPTPADPNGGHVGLAELSLHSDFDGPDGPTRLLAELARGGSRGVSAARLLRGLGEPGANAIAQAWPDMTARERRLAVRVLSDMAPNEPAARAALLVAARSDDAELHAAALEALRSAGAGNELTTLMRDGDDEAARVLARAIPGRALQVLLPALVAEQGVARDGLRQAVADALVRAPDQAVPLVAEWATEAQPVEATAVVAEALGPAGEDGATLGTALLRGAAPRAETFEEVWRVVRAAAALPSDSEVDAWLRVRAETDERWMIRAESATSLRARRSPLATEVVLALARDEFPRARERAAELLQPTDASRDALLQLAQRDAWPRVRAAAVTALGMDEGARELLVGALGDPKARVRLAAIEAFRTAGDGRAAEAVAARLARENELATVQRAAARYLGEVCAVAHVQTLLDAVARGRRPNAYEPDVETAVVAVAALARLGGPDVLAQLAALRDGGPPEAIRAAAARGLTSPGACQDSGPGH